MEISEIVDRESFEAWLEDKPVEWAQALAARVALRVAPLAWSVAGLTDDQLPKEHRENLTLLTFRASFISSAACKYPADDMKSAADAARATANVALAVTDATYDARAAANAARAAVYATRAAANADRATSYAARSAANAAYAADADIWESIRADCEWLEKFPASADGIIFDEKEIKENKHDSQQLVGEPLWLENGEQQRNSAIAMPSWAQQAFDKFTANELAQETSFALIADWYFKQLIGQRRFLFTWDVKSKDIISIAQMADKDWKGRPVEVMDRVAEIAGWERTADAELGTDSKVSEEVQIPKIVDGDGLEKWLEDKPPEWAQAIALRAALCVAPLVFDGIKYNSNSLDMFTSIAVDVFRACFVGLVVRKEGLSLEYIANAAKNPARSSTTTGKGVPFLAGNAAYAAAAALAPNYNTSYGIDAAFLTATDPDDLTKPPPTRRLARDAVTHALLVEPQILDAVRADCNWLDEQTKNLTLEPGFPFSLLKRPLWMRDFNAGQKQENYLPDSIRQALDDFEDFPVVHESSLGLILDWYQSVYGSQTQTFSKLGRKADIAIATQGDEFWQGAPVEVMDKVAEIAGLGQKPYEWDFFLSYNENDEAVAKRISGFLEDEGYSVFSQFNDFTAGKSFVHEMNRGLAGMGRMIAIYSPDYFKSGPCMSEWEAAYLTDSSAEKGKLVPFLVKACAPTPLAKRIVWKSLQGLNREQERETVLDFIRDADTPKTRSALRKILKESASPDIVADSKGIKLDAIPNKSFDTPFIEEELLDLPEVLRSLIETTLAGVEQTNCPSIIKAALKAYAKELAARGVNCILGVLRAQMDVIETGLSSERTEYWCSDDALAEVFEKIKEYHLKLVTHYPLDQTRQKLINAVDVDLNKLDRDIFDKHRRDILKATDDAHKAGELTETYRDISKNQLNVARDVLDVRTPDFTPTADAEFDLQEQDRIARINDAKKRRLIDVVGTADKSLDVMTKMTKLAESNTAQGLMSAFKRLGDWFW